MWLAWFVLRPRFIQAVTVTLMSLTGRANTRWTPLLVARVVMVMSFSRPTVLRTTMVLTVEIEHLNFTGKLTQVSCP